MPDTKIDETAGGTHQHGGNGVPPESPSNADLFADLSKLIGDLVALCSQLAVDASALVAAQWRLTSYVVTGSTRIWALRCVALLAIAGLALGSWVFLNVALWSAVGDATPIGAAPPLALFLLNSGVAAGLYFWQKGLKLR